MVHGIVIVFVLLASIFAFVHVVAVVASLYWYYWWFDIVMHFWGGGLLALGVHAFSTFRLIRLRPSTRLMLITLTGATVSWEVFEFFAGLYEPTAYVWETTKDVIVGFGGGLLTHAFLKSRYNRGTNV